VPERVGTPSQIIKQHVLINILGIKTGKIMKKILFITVAITTILFVSCSKEEDYTNPENLFGTTWKCKTGLGSETEYASLKFISTSSVEGWSKQISEDEIKDWTGTYIIFIKTITVNYGTESFTGTIEGTNMNVVIDGVPYLFKKQ
jgi:hypothetical protein